MVEDLSKEAGDGNCHHDAKFNWAPGDQGTAPRGSDAVAVPKKPERLGPSFVSRELEFIITYYRNDFFS